jgi:hypothetical protein
VVVGGDRDVPALLLQVTFATPPRSLGSPLQSGCYAVLRFQDILVLPELPCLESKLYNTCALSVLALMLLSVRNLQKPHIAEAEMAKLAELSRF